MARLRRVTTRMPGWTRRRRGSGFSYADAGGDPLPAEDVARIRSLAIPPAWTDVWICPVANGHLQAVGTDAAGRRQYLYHPDWHTRRNRSKFERVTAAAARLPQARKHITEDLDRSGMPLARAAATAVRLLDVGYFRIGNDAYTDAHGSFGLTTLERQHVRRRDEGLLFSFVGKSGISHSILVDDAAAIAALSTMRNRRDDSPRLLAYRDGKQWRPLSSADVNAYLSELFGGGVTAKDFRTWHATVIAAEALALTEETGTTKAATKRAVRQATVEVASYLGNTPTVARSSYIDPRVIDRFESGVTIKEAAQRRYRSAHARQVGIERAVLELLGG